MLKLPQVTLCCVDTQFPDLGLDALLRSMKNIEFGNAVFFTRKNGFDFNRLNPKIRLVEIEELKGVEAYSLFVLRSLANHINTSHVLVVQWDGYVVHPETWMDEFLAYDYIGATWPEKNGSGVVGNGGFSLRSMKLLNVLQSDNIHHHHPEDDCIAKTNRSVLEHEYGIRFAPPELADRFSYEFGSPPEPSFGFHGMFHLPDVMSASELTDFIRKMPQSIIFNGYFPGFLRRLHSTAKEKPEYQEVFNTLQLPIGQAIEQVSVAQVKASKHLVKALIESNLLDFAKAMMLKRLDLFGYSKPNLKLMIAMYWQCIWKLCFFK